MVHINRTDCHEMLTDAEFQMRYPEAYAVLNKEQPFAAIGRSLRLARVNADFSLREMAKALDMPATAYSDIERGRVLPSDSMINRIFKIIEGAREE